MKGRQRRTFRYALFSIHFFVFIFVVANFFLIKDAQAAIPAFPGAEGFGSTTIGGRFGDVVKVTNLNDSGTGSLRDCVENRGSNDPRICVFAVGGTIYLKDDISISKPYLTIAGQTAPGDGILLTQDPNSPISGPLIKIRSHDIVIRYLRLRIGAYGSSVDNDNIVIEDGSYNVVIDHNSLSWAIDENLSTYGSSGSGTDAAHDITISWNIIAEGLHDSSHPEGPHSKGMLTKRSYNIAVHNNLFAHNFARNPKITINSDLGMADVIDNVVYNYGVESTEGPMEIEPDFDSPGRVNVIGNYVIPGADTDCSGSECFYVSGRHGEVFLEGNYLVGNNESNQYNMMIDERFPPEQSDTRFSSPYINSEGAQKTYTKVLDNAGASYPKRDETDTRIVNEVKNQSGRVKDCVTRDDPDCSSSSKVIVPEGWINYANGSVPTDNDNDGIADAWENEKGGNLNPSDLAPSGYTWIEEYINVLPGGYTPPPAPVYQCSDGIDNDGDGLVDMDDPGCDSETDNDEYNEPAPVYQCSDGVDNDGDGLVDMDDPGCDSETDNDEYNEPSPVYQCSDGVDNDGDGLVDMDDPGCDSETDNDEYNEPAPVYQCSDGVDNDGDGLVDMDDPGCDSETDNDEYNEPAPVYQCSDGVDNDGDGLVDMDDPGCDSETDNDEYNEPAPVYQCSDGVDNDGDGLIDMADPGCESETDNDEYNEPAPVYQCSDGVDNDGDGLVDMDDPGCDSETDNDEYNEPAPVYQCSDNIDNDKDGLIDMEDPGCDSETDNDEYNDQEPIFECSDGIDNDGDQLIDMADPGCDSLTDMSEYNEPEPEPIFQCSDNLDNDGDGLVDMGDPGCESEIDNNEYNEPEEDNDTVNPNVRILTPHVGQTYRRGQIRVRVMATDASGISEIKLYVKDNNTDVVKVVGVCIDAYYCSQKIHTKYIADGQYTIIAEVKDGSHNRNLTTESVVVVIDKDHPVNNSSKPFKLNFINFFKKNKSVFSDLIQPVEPHSY